MVRSCCGWLVLAAVAVTMGMAGRAFSADSPGAGQGGPKKAAFEQIFSEWKALLSELRGLRDEYRKAPAEKRPAIETRYNELLQKGEQMQPKVVQSAEAAFRENPKAPGEAGDFLLSTVYLRTRNDDYEEAQRLATLLMDGGHEDPMLHAFLGIAAFCVGDLEVADKELKRGQQEGLFEKLGGDFAKLGPMWLDEIPFYREASRKERELRAAEAKADDLPRVAMKTSKGDLEIELFENEAPNTVANFISLVEKGFYNGTPFHRVLPQFMAQGGDPTGTGGGGPGYTIPCECHQPNARVHFRGSLSMAHAGRDTGGSQFFLTFRPTHHLDGQHTVFGRVIKGFDVLAKLQRRDPERPEGPEPDKIVEAKVLRKRNHPYEPKKSAGKPKPQR